MFEELWLLIIKTANKVANVITAGESVAQAKLFEAKAVAVKYIFLDIVDFTKNRSIEAQSDIVKTLNNVVSIALKKNEAIKERRILLPTGDGMCIALFPSLFDESKAYDIHLNIALDILAGVAAYNVEAKDKSRIFEVRVGLNENTDNIIIDINDNQNVAGRGVNMAQRTMSKADGGQILIGEATYQTLCERERYLDLFRSYATTTKHGDSFQVYQFIPKDHKGLNTDVPNAFKPKQKNDPRLTNLVAFYMAHAIKNSTFFEQMCRSNKVGGAGTVLLYFLAYDSNNKRNSQRFDNFSPRTANPDATIQEQYDYYYDNSGYWIIDKLSGMIYDTYLSAYSRYFEGHPIITFSTVIKPEGKDKLKTEFPDIWQQFDLDNVS